MKILRFYIILLSLFGLFKSSYSQEINRTSFKEIGFKIGIAHLGIQDDRFSARSKSGWTPSYEINFKKIKEHSKQEWNFGFLFAHNLGNDALLHAKLIRPNITYSYERKFNQMWIGGFFNSSTILHFPRTNTRHFENNPISYTISKSIGPKISLNRNIDHDHRWSFDGEAQISLLSYVVRPAYGHPYPEKYLQSGTFHPTRRNMTTPLMKSGKIHSIDKLQSFKIVLQISYLISDHTKISVNYRVDYLSTTNQQQSQFSSQEILLGINFIY